MGKARTRAPGKFGMGLPGGKAAMVVAAIALACCARVPALNPSLDISQYSHTAWRVRDGFFRGGIWSIAQTPDGYLWLGTEFGVLRFDGVRAVALQPPAGQQLPGGRIRSLLGARDGRLWIGTDEGLASWKDGKLTTYAELSGQAILSLIEDHEGTVWAACGSATARGRLCSIQSGNAKCYDQDGSFGKIVSWVYEDSRGTLWAASLTGLWRWRPGPPQFYPMAEAVAAAEAANVTLLISTARGLKQLVDSRIEDYSPQAGLQQLRPTHLLRDHDGGIWIGTVNGGLLHVHSGTTDRFALFDGLSGDWARAVFEDREGNIWVGTSEGLDRFRNFAISTVAGKQGVSNYPQSVLAAADGSTWLGTLNGLDRLEEGKITVYSNGRPASSGRDAKGARRITDSGLPGSSFSSIFQDRRGRIWVGGPGGLSYLDDDHFVLLSDLRYAHAIAEDTSGSLWISTERCLFQLREGRVVEQIPWARISANYVALALLADTAHGGLWLGFWKGGVAYFKDGQIRASYAAANGLGAGRVTHIQTDHSGTLWAATQGGLSRIKDGRVATLTSKNGLPCDTVHWSMEDNQGSMWVSTSCALVQLSQSELTAWAADPNRKIQAIVFDTYDGFRSYSTTTGASPIVTKTADGKLWFLPSEGVSVIDPHHLPFNQVPPPVRIEQVSADDKTYDVSSGLRLPAQSRDVIIDYTALSLVAPEKVRFRVKLEGQDKDWKELVNERRVRYTNLPPRHFRFRVMAANNSGVWNEAGDSLDFSIAPAYYQTAWFLCLCVAGLLGLAYGFYRYRLLQQAQHFNMRLEERINERTRIARELHDTLLQSFQGVLLKLYAVSTRVHPAEVRDQLDGALEQGEQAIAEGRNAVQGMRSSTVIKNDLACALTEVGERLTPEQDAQNPIDFLVTVEGETKDLHPILRDEVYRIASEAIRNGFRHSGGTRIKAEIYYDDRQLRVRILDNGKGIEAKVLDGGGRQGHFGLPGMKERAKLAGGKLTVWSKPGSGTEVELTIPATRAYIRTSTPRSIS